MFAGFKMKICNFEECVWEDYIEKGKKLYEHSKQEVQKSLDKYLSPDGILQAEEIEKDWFPSCKANVFLSHSHTDEKLAIAIAGFLSEFGLTTFIDSCVWGYADELLRAIDNKYCVSGEKPDGSIDTYSYSKRNQSTAHVHMILNSALMKMIDRTECLIFLNTPNSLKIEDLSKEKTSSCWIYSELLMSKCVGKKKIARKPPLLIKGFCEHSDLKVDYKTDTSHLIPLSKNDIEEASGQGKKVGIALLDQLYDNKGIVRETDYATEEN